MIDDDEDDASMVKSMLGRGSFNSYEFECITSYDEGLKRLVAQTADVFLLDQNLGARSGLQLLQEAGGSALSKPVILLTGVDDPEVDVAALESGASHYVPKASLVDDHLLERTIRYAIRRANDFKELQSIERLKLEKQSAEAASEAKNLFLANVSHEIRTPLGAILGFADLALGTTEEARKNRFLEIIQRNAKHLLSLVNDLLDISKIEAGRYDVDVKPADWRKIIDDVMQTLRVSADEKNIDLEFIDTPEAPRFLFTDAQCLKQILINLIGNAIKFSYDGKISVIAQVRDKFSLAVSDAGIGMTHEQQERLFKPYSQGAAGHHRQYGGTGLGLHHSRKMAEALGGNLELSMSEAGVGSTFTVSLPGNWVRVQDVNLFA